MSVILNIVSAFDEKGVRKALKSFSQLETTTQKASYALKQYGGPAAIAAIGAVTAGLTKAVKAAAEDQKSQEQLKIALENTVFANQSQVAAVEDSITALMYQTATADDVLRPALSKLVRATKDVTQAQSLLKLALDISAGSGRDLTSVSTALSRAALGNFTALTRLGIPLDQNAVKAKDLDGVLGSLSASFSGAATKNAQTFEGQVTTLKIALGELEETVGKQLIPILGDYAQVLVDLTTDTQGAESSTKKWFDRIATGIQEVAKNTPALGPLLRVVGLVNNEVRDQAAALRQNSQVTSRVTKNIKDLTVAEDDSAKSTKAASAAKNKAAAAAKKHAAALAKAKEAAAEMKRQAEELAQAIQDKLNAQLDDATAKLADAQGAFDSFGKGVGQAITSGFNFADAQSEVAGNAADVKTALAKQAEAQAKVNKAQADYNFFKRDDYAQLLADAMGDLALATDEVTAAQAKPQTFFESLNKQADKAKKFGELVSRLMAANLNEAALQQVLAAGVDGGTAIAEEILGSADGVLRANDLTASMTDLADKMAAKSAAKYYQAGVDSAKSFLAGIQATMGIAVPAFDISGIDLSGFSVGGLGTLMAEGGVVTRATTITAGEAGPEAIIPLDRMGEFGFGGGGAGVTINVNGGDPNAVVNALRTYMRQNGSIPIKVSNNY
jgi:predicted nucleic acid-binding protein